VKRALLGECKAANLTKTLWDNIHAHYLTRMDRNVGVKERINENNGEGRNAFLKAAIGHRMAAYKRT
jgi:hypothetical protein